MSDVATLSHAPLEGTVASPTDDAPSERLRRTPWVACDATATTTGTDQMTGKLRGASAEQGTLQIGPSIVRDVPVATPPQQVRLVDRFELLQQFEGTVLAIEGDAFTARLKDRTTPTESGEVATFWMSDVSDSDGELVAIGAVFYWSMGYRIRPWKQRERSSFLRFRRLPVWTRTDLERARTQANEWAHLLDELR